LDGEPSFTIDKELFILSPFKEGGEIDDEELHDLVKSSQYKRAKDKAMYLLGIKNYSKRQFISKLREDCDKEIAEQVTEKMEELGFVNDKNYAEILTRDLINIKKFGKARIKTELFQRGIDRDIIDEIMAETEIDSDENIQNILEKKYPLWSEDEKVKRRAVAFLQRRGYSYSQIRQAISAMEYE
ncbi:MAG: regulatory protein RecX, partial [Clostridia bacterium]